VAEELAELLSDWVLFVCTIGGGCWDLTKSGGAMGTHVSRSEGWLPESSRELHKPLSHTLKIDCGDHRSEVGAARDTIAAPRPGV